MWPNGIIYYLHLFGSVLLRPAIRSAMDAWEAKTCIKFTEITFTDIAQDKREKYKHKVYIAQLERTCTAHVGMRTDGNDQYVRNDHMLISEAGAACTFL